ncbi:MAG: prepilin-type N-terminal cleavage/methylation domain-containing protein [Candidatus Magnetominusculus sp. LBB02]|nr:prepilin-type N-terminal cleavage/methylation domain-containing protein [Candidatus Magnetominusculus sp. LBB02]
MAKIKEKGFTLIEVMAAIAILAIGITALIELFGGSLRSIGYAESHTKAAVAAESEMRNVISEQTLKEDSYTKHSENGYTYDIAIERINKEKTDYLQYELFSVTLTMNYNAGRKSKTYTLKTLAARKKSTVATTSK